MSTVLTNGIIIPDNGSRNWGGDLANNWNIIDLNVGYMTDVKNRVTTLENSVAENSSNIEINTSNISALQTSKQDVIEDLETIRTGASAGATAVQPSALNNYVDLSSGQTIDGSKVFTNDIRIIKNSPFCYLFSNNYIKGEIPSSNIYQGIRFFDDPNSSSANHITGGFELTYDTSGYTIASINARTYANDRQVWKSINFRIANDDTRSIDFYPNSDSEINLGTSTNKWKTLNGINPGALSLPSDTSISIDTTSFKWGENFEFTPLVDGYLFINISRSNGVRSLSMKTGRGEYLITNQQGIFRYTLPVYKDRIVTVRADSSITESVMPIMTLFSCQGNV